MNEKSEVLKFYDEYSEKFNDLEQNHEFTEKFYQSFLSGNNNAYQKYIKETKNFDEEWIKTVESYIPSINKIVNNPQSTLKMEEEIVNIEKAKKITSQSIRHLSANTHLIKDVDARGNVIPKKILTTYPEIDYGTYENRFIMTLIDRLFIFVRNRYEVIKENVLSFEKNHFNFESTFPINDSTVEMKLDLVLTNEVNDRKINKYNKELLTRVEYLNKIVTSLKASQFMELMKNQRKIHPPIMKTNIIMKNVDYRNAYLLWLFLDRYNTLAFTIDVKEKNLSFNEEYFKAIHRQVLMLYSTVVSNQEKNLEKYKYIKPKKYRRKSIKIRRTHPDDIVLKPEDEILEDNTLNEYFLAANKRLFKQSLDYHKTQVKTYETSVKRALRETLDISNALYQSFFELEENDDIFRQLITEVDVSKELTEARRKAMIAKMIREVKEVDFNNAIRQERKFLDEIAKYDNLLLKEYNAQTRLLKKDLREMKRLEKERKKALEQRKLLAEKLKQNKEKDNELRKQRVSTNKNITKYRQELRNEQKKELSSYRKELNTKTRKEIQELRKKYRKQTRITNYRLEQEKKKLEQRYKQRIAKIEKDYEARFKKEQQKIIKNYQRKIALEEKKLKKEQQQDLTNSQILENLKLEYENKLKQFEQQKEAKLKEIKGE